MNITATGLQTCHRLDTNFNECLRQAIEGALTVFKNGDSAVDIPALEPFSIDNVSVDHTGRGSNFNLRSSLKNAKTTGLSTAQIVRVAMKFDNKFALKIEGKAKTLMLAGDYTMNGQMLVLPIKGKGKANLTLTDPTANIDLRGEVFEKGGEKYINITTFRFKMTPKHANFFFENIFNGDKVLSDTINTFMNENWQVVYDTLFPGYEASFGDKFKSIANRIFQNVPAKIIFPD